MDVTPQSHISASEEYIRGRVERSKMIQISGVVEDIWLVTESRKVGFDLFIELLVPSLHADPGLGPLDHPASPLERPQFRSFDIQLDELNVLHFVRADE